MAERTIVCREHGGRLTYQAKRGRQPVRCGPLVGKCSKAENQITNTVRDVPSVGKVAVVTTAPPAESNGNAPNASNPSVPPAMAAKAQLEALGWLVKGRGWHDASDTDANGMWAEISASRGAETLVMSWHGGHVVQQNYSLDHEQPDANETPPNKLGYDPEELTDRELVERIRGMKVAWWNTLASSVETGVIGTRVSIEHIFDDNSAKRLVKFVDHTESKFRAFHVSALLKVG